MVYMLRKQSMHARAHTHTHARAHTHTCACTHTRVRTRMHTNAHAHTHAHIHTHTRTCTHMQAHTHTRTHTCAHTHMHKVSTRPLFPLPWFPLKTSAYGDPIWMMFSLLFGCLFVCFKFHVIAILYVID